MRQGNTLLADAFCAARFQTRSHQMFGTLPRGVDCRAIIDRATPDM
jgi:putative acyl-CoA dehydrogenase